MRFAISAILSVLVLAMFLSLGFWQMQRMAWKAGVLAQIDARIAADPVAVPVDPIASRDQFLPVMAEGILRGGVRVLASTRDAGAGYRVVQVLEMPGGRRVLLDRGFQPIEQHSEMLAGVSGEVRANLLWPDELDRWTPAPEPEKNLWFARDIRAIATHLNAEPLLLVAREVSPSWAGITPMPITSKGIPNRHLEYMFTWFLLAATWVMMTGFALWRMKRRTA